MKRFDDDYLRKLCGSMREENKLDCEAAALAIEQLMAERDELKARVPVFTILRAHAEAAAIPSERVHIKLPSIS